MNGASAPVAIGVRGLRKRYGALEAVRGIDFEVRQGEIYGLIGPDGAGKTSTFQIAGGVMEPTAGSIEIFGRPARETRAETGYLTQTFSLYPDLTVDENIRYIADLRMVPPREIAERAGRYLEMFDLRRFGDRLAGKLSGGMKQKLALTCALVPQPRVLLLDEPTTGVDPVSRREFWDALAHLAAEGLTILVATPYLDEAERCHRVALIHLGEIQDIGTPRELRRRLNATRLELRTADLSKAEEALGDAIGPDRPILDAQRFGDRLDLIVPDPDGAERVIGERMAAAQITIEPMRRDEPTLENTFVATLRRLGRESYREPFPNRHSNEHLRGQVAIGAEKLTRRFGAFTAVNGVSLEIKYGEIYGLLGANGAGKTTTIKMLCGLLEASSGTMRLAGESGQLRSEAVRQRIGYMSQKFSLYDDLTIEENLEFFAGVYRVPPDEQEEKRRWTLEFSGLSEQRKQLTGSLPGGWKQRVAFGSAIQHEPGILFLDEPTSGVDPLARRAFWTIINRMADRGAAVLVTTHYLEEAEQCNRLGFMVAGELVAEGTPTGIKRAQPGHLLEILTDEPQRAADRLKQKIDRWRVALFGDRLHVITPHEAERGIAEIRQMLEAEGLRVNQARAAEFSLEDVFISIVEQARTQGKIAGEE